MGFDAARLAEIQCALSAHQGELERNDYRRLLAARAQMNAVLGPERVFGFGSAGMSHDYAELLRAYEWTDSGRLVASAPAELEMASLRCAQDFRR